MQCMPIEAIPLWWCGARQALLLLGLLLLLLLLLSPMAVRAQGIESIMAPGLLIQAHARYDDECQQCHVKLDRKAQDGLCMACHKEVGSDVRGKNGYHGRLPQPLVCRTCHTDHKGRDAQTATFDHGHFDHSRTDYALRGKHGKVACSQCHVGEKKWRAAPVTCIGCHRKDDAHKGSLGDKCGACHTETNWKSARFDHDTTRFPLTGKHIDGKCIDCHRDNVYKDTPTACYACHRKIDDEKGHRGLFGEKCDTCHSTRAWKPSTFNHDIDTRYVLRGKHHSVACKECHSGNLYKEKLSRDCQTCHKNDDKHKGTLGGRCESCHNEASWKEVQRFDHDKTSFPLAGRHSKVECKSCHVDQLYKDTPKDCYSCHQLDDKHRLNLGKSCADCHDESEWKLASRFDHNRTRFALRNAHAAAPVTCASCHRDLQGMRNTPLACVACHRKDDRHEAQLGEKCENCHNDKVWKGVQFDHARAPFALTGRHLLVACAQCHTTLRYKDAARDCYSCHRKDDKHQQVLGVRCESCHSTRSWPAWSFDHDRQTSYRLEGEHVRVACQACHTAVAPAGRDAAPLRSACITCHRLRDVHNGGFGPRCEICHQATGWRRFKGRPGMEPSGALGNSTLMPGVSQ